jgi:hypothetical protein
MVAGDVIAKIVSTVEIRKQGRRSPEPSRYTESDGSDTEKVST